MKASVTAPALAVNANAALVSLLNGWHVGPGCFYSVMVLITALTQRELCRQNATEDLKWFRFI